MLVGGVFFHDDQGILLHGVVCAIVKDDLGHAFGAGLNDVALFQGHVVVCIDPAVPIRFLDPDGAVQSGEVGLLGTHCAGLRGSGVSRNQLT